MKTTLRAPIARLTAAALVCFAAQSASAGTVTISSTPLATAGGSSVLPNLMFVLDASGSMDSDYNGDFVNDSGKCMTRSGSNTSCTRGDPPWGAGGPSAMNGVGYDPLYNYKPGLNSAGATVQPAPLTATAVPDDAYGVQATGNTDMTTGIQDLRYCNSNNVCKRNGSDNAGTSLIGGTDDQGIVHPAGRFPYRTNASNSSSVVFGLPEMMSQGSFSGSGTTVTVTTLAPHGLATNDWIFVSGSGSTNAAQVTVTNANTFTYASGSSFGATTSSFRKHSAATVARVAGSTTVTVTSTAHGLVTNDIILINSPSGSPAGVNSGRTVTVVDANTFTYTQTGGTTTVINTSPAATWVRTDLYNQRGTVNGTANSYLIIPIEYCSDVNLTNCVAVAVGGTPPAGFTVPAYVRYCRTQEQAYSPALISDAAGTPRCRSKWVGSGSTQWTYPRFGYFKRDIITSGTASYARSVARGDCVGAPTCTYTEEIQNYARWWTYYRTRMQMMKTAAGRAFLPFINGTGTSNLDKLRIGFITINPFYVINGNSDQGSVQANRYLPIAPFTTAQASRWYTMFYLQEPNQSTPLREALSRVGWIYAGKLNTGLTSGIPKTDDPVLESCQRNFTILTTDGYWNGNAGQDLGGGAIGNMDNANPTTDSPYAQPAVDRTTTGTFDGGKGTTVSTATPTTTLEQVVCQAAAASTFGSGTQQACGCGVDEHRIKQRQTAVTTTVSTTDGVLDASSPSVGTPAYTFSDFTGCSPAVVATTTTTGATITETKVCSGNNTITFADGRTQSCSCGGSRKELIRETRTGATVTNKTVDGIPQPTTYSGGVTVWTYSKDGTTYVATAYSSSGTACASSGTTLNSIAQNISGGATTSGTTGTALTIALSPNPSIPVAGTPLTTVVNGGYPNTLADVAMYYYRSDLRGGTDPNNAATGPALNLGGTGTKDVSANNVPAKSGAKDFVTHQHMVTFTVGLADGLMRYQSDYDSAGTGDFANIKNATSNGCFWVSGTCDWPKPVGDDASALDDLWHAAVNGRGQYYLATNADSLSTGIQTALTAVNAQVAAAAASATSSPNVTQTDNQIFSTTYETNTWSGKVFAQTIDPATGNVSPTIQWQADQQLLGKVGASSDTRVIWTFDDTSGTKLKPFTWATLSAAEQAFFLDKCVPASTMVQCASLTGTPLATANNGSSLVAYLRGQLGDEATIFRDRTYIDLANNNAVVQTVLGDTISAKPAYLRRPQFNYADAVTPAYSSFLAANTNRSPRVYVAANDGYLHSFHGDTGEEMWAYLPRFLMPGLYQLADKGYGANLHRYYADGSPETGEVFDSTAGAWKSILVAGVAGGGRGYYALDITDPANPKGLWEFCSDATLCAIQDDDLGLTYGNAVIGKSALDGRWIVLISSGLNNISPGSGIGYFYVLDAITGAVIYKVSTGVGENSTPTPSGLMKISAFYDSALTDATFRYAYAGDQLGNVWRLDTRTDPPTVLHIATLSDGSTPPRGQVITTRPSLTRISGNRVLYFGTGRYLGSPDLSDPGAASGISWQQTLWAFKDKDSDYGDLRTNGLLVQQVLSMLNPTDRGITSNPVDWNTKDGWFVDFNPSFSGVPNSPGEGVNLVDPRLVLGTLVVTTNVPATGGSSCSVGGTSFDYNFDFKTGSAVSTSAGGVVGRSLGGTITVGVAIVQLPSGAIKNISTGADTSKTTSSVNTSASGAAVRRFSYRIR